MTEPASPAQIENLGALDAPETPATEPPVEKAYPTHFQRKTLWGAVTSLSIVLIGAVSVFLITLFTHVLDFLQPVLVPLALAGIIAYLLSPLIEKLRRRGLKRTSAMLTVYLTFHCGLLALAIVIVPPVVRQSIDFFQGKDILSRLGTVRDVVKKEYAADEKSPGGEVSAPPMAVPAVPPSAVPTPGAPATAAPAPAAPAWEQKWAAFVAQHRGDVGQVMLSAVNYVEQNTERLKSWAAETAGSSFKGLIGLIGYFIGIVLVPIYLYYFLKEGNAIRRNWADYLPLRRSQFKDEVVATLTEINGYLIAFFRGQMLVSIIDGLLVGFCLALIGLPYGLLIGVCVALLGLVPFIGSILCWVPAVFISIAHFSQAENQWEMFQYIEHVSQGGQQWDVVHSPLWPYPLIVTGIFIIVQKINSFVTTPRIVGDSVGLHPLTVIFSVLFWSLLIGGFLGALLAVPLSASVKVLFRRYIWERRLQPAVERANAGGDLSDDSDLGL
jgi:predicted PurR-regulated permease PerM